MTSARCPVQSHLFGVQHRRVPSSVPPAFYEIPRPIAPPVDFAGCLAPTSFALRHELPPNFATSAFPDPSRPSILCFRQPPPPGLLEQDFTACRKSTAARPHVTKTIAGCLLLPVRPSSRPCISAVFIAQQPCSRTDECLQVAPDDPDGGSHTASEFFSEVVQHCCGAGFFSLRHLDP